MEMTCHINSLATVTTLRMPPGALGRTHYSLISHSLSYDRKYGHFVCDCDPSVDLVQIIFRGTIYLIMCVFVCMCVSVCVCNVCV